MEIGYVKNVNSKKKLNLSILLVLTLFYIPFLSAVELSSTTLSTSSGNVNITITSPSVFVDALQLTSTSVYLEELRSYDAETETLTFNITTDHNKSGTDLPYFSSTDGTSKVITSGVNVTGATIITNTSFACSKIGVIKYTPAGGTEITYLSKAARNLCSSSYITLTDKEISAGSNTITIGEAAAGDTCSGFFDAGVSFFQFIAILIIISAGGILILFMRSDGDTDTGQLVFIAVMIILGAVVLTIGMIIINNINGC